MTIKFHPESTKKSAARGQCVHSIEMFTLEDGDILEDARVGASIGWSDWGVSLPTQDVLVQHLSKESQTPSTAPSARSCCRLRAATTRTSTARSTSSRTRGPATCSSSATVPRRRARRPRPKLHKVRPPARPPARPARRRPRPLGRAGAAGARPTPTLVPLS